MFNLKSILKYSNISGIVYGDAASSLYGLNTSDLTRINLWTEDTEHKSNVYSIVKMKRKPYGNLTQLRKGLWIVSPEEAIVTMIVDEESEDQFIYESIERFLQLGGSIERLYQIAKWHENLDRVKHYVETAEEWLEDFYNY